MSSPLLETRNLQIRFGGVLAIRDVSFHLAQGEVLGLIGPNGAGKTSVFNCITGFYRPTSGAVLLDGMSLTGHTSYRISRLGIRRTFQNIRLFDDLSVLANILAGAHAARRSTDDTVRAIHSTCTDLGIDTRLLSRPAHELAHGLQRRVELARALIADPRVLLVDEPGAGLNASEKRLIIALLRGVARDRNIGVIVIDHDIGMIARACDRVVVLDFGKVICIGTPREVRRNPAVVAAYLGG